jgi:hypothetical protein
MGEAAQSENYLAKPVVCCTMLTLLSGPTGFFPKISLFAGLPFLQDFPF